MKTYLECIPCFFRQAIEAAKLVGASKKTQKKIIDRLAREIKDFPLSDCPPEMGRKIYAIVAKMTGKKDPFLAVKRRSNRLALKIYPGAKKRVEKSKDRLLAAVELAIAGNIIDYGVGSAHDVEASIKKILEAEDKIIKQEKKKFFRYEMFKKVLIKAKDILILADNSGEVVFDRILIETIREKYPGKRIIYAVKSSPIINDALPEDARACGVDKIAEITTSCAGAPGTILSLCPEKFLRVYRKADMVISKGQGNFEALSDAERPVFFLFMAKCDVVAEHLGCNVGDVMLLYKNSRYYSVS